MTAAQYGDWNVLAAKARYGINGWGNGYFDVNERGEVVVLNPLNKAAPPLSLLDVIGGLRDRELQMPVLLRIENIIDQSIRQLNESFRAAIGRAEYRGGYQGVFPIKVNQQAQIVEEVAQFGAQYGHGFEVGSKPEMIAALSSMAQGEGLLICNGYKDQEFIDLSLQAVKLGIRCFLVIESPAELPIIIERSKALGIAPFIGIRAKVISTIGGYWNATSGDRSVFGLSASQIIQVVDTLRANKMLDCLQMLHCHLGSQIPNIRDVRGGVSEACRYYADLCREGAAMGYIDLGGGLAVDYTGAHSQDGQSRNYSLQEYCEDVVDTIMATLDGYGLDHPTIVTESGRATVAYSSVLLFNVVDVARFEALPIAAPAEGEHELIRNMRDIQDYLQPKRVQECYNDAHFYRDEVRELFKRGQIGLRMRAVAENLFLEVLSQIKEVLAGMEQVPSDLENLEASLADIYYGNFSLFQSLPDSWAIDQLFPVMPVQRLDEYPDRRTVLADITCDCDGKIDRFVSDHGFESTLPVHSLNSGEEYYLGVFLVGAYQETLGDLHNLFGDTNVVSIRLNEDSSFEFVKEIQGDTIADVLGYVEYQTWDLKLRYRNRVEAAVKSGRISARERQEMLNTFDASLRGYTYYEKEHQSLLSSATAVAEGRAEAAPVLL
ncbi:biosynthetic arginine decarboxylase [Spongiibacter taiwanensis]|uniref:biosynthetic arginine decarboxylase n=1 Tax=Spongiibacter taiwanensis TaxID=1748242 RepID=UPI002035D67C|nr:biosynthetic arginine decarboxylase [Spongiibacter taiwanensis]USA42676.1 biosynthetic arginine decarboxylase [Spongiibacter taiwanensis]